ncbi:hypothetical protein [Curtobacterium sp. ISL-83]|uniref:hypothetical protein n=1 Tax=Curtobacterium sp. ISL-83 TaxID=2819145 RepID=UPI001BE9FF89|nr:hypothetical protein [Curtobacterium sp. ISL-83]MBT2504003.1 hypothetical protein [Curtobacterium sp. ISL-83]
MAPPAPLPDPLGAIPFRVRGAVADGVSRERLRRRDLVTPVHGVRASACSDVTPVEALAVVLRPDQWFSHVTAARIWSAPLPARLRDDTTVHVSSSSEAAMRRNGVIGHRCRYPDVREHEGKRVSSPARTWFECAGVLTVAELVAVGDHMVGRAGLASVDDLAAAVRPGARGAQVARAALERVRVGSESAMESALRLAVVDAGFPEPQLNIDVHGSSGDFLGRVDMAWPEYRIALEYDGDHHRDQATFRRDQRRGNGFVVNGWLVIHATAVDPARPAVLFERLRQAFADRAGRTPRRPTGHRAEDVARGGRG